VRAGQKTGHFLDQRANRMRVGELAAGCDVLDLFASTGGFTVHAAAGGRHQRAQRRPVGAHLGGDEEEPGPQRPPPRCGRLRTTTSEVGRRVRGDERAGPGRQHLRPGHHRSAVVRPESAPASTAHFGPMPASPTWHSRWFDRAARSCRRRVPAGSLPRHSSRLCSMQPTSPAMNSIELARTGHDLDHPVTFPRGRLLEGGLSGRVR
jgi:23S rRNA (cytosine1962-C5)-methyltransferase